MTDTAGSLRRFLDRLTPLPVARQVESEFRPFLDLLASTGVRSYLEVGAYRGGTFYRVMRRLPPGSLGVTVDDGRRTVMRNHRPVLAIVGDRLRGDGYRIEHVFGDSQESDTIATVRRLAPFDAVLIDADHRYAGARRDWESYGPMARRIVAFHDIAEEHTTRAGTRVEVARLWREIVASGATTREFVAPGSKRGIGVVLRDQEKPVAPAAGG